MNRSHGLVNPRFVPGVAVYRRPPRAKFETLDFDGRVGVGKETLPSEEGTPQKGSRTFTCKQRPKYGLDCLMCAIFARER